MLTLSLSVLGLPSVDGQPIEIRDRHGIPIVSLNDVKMFRYSQYFKAEVPEFQANVRNLTAIDINVPLDATIYFKDGSVRTIEAFVSVGLTRRAVKSFTAPFPYTFENFDRVQFAVNKSWASPEDKRLAAIENERQAEKKQANRRTACAQIYRLTANKKISELTVKEEQEVRLCQKLGLYSPR